MKKYTLIVLAAGFGSRYGSLKQIDDLSGEGETIIDFSLYDAIEAGFNHVVFIIRKEIEHFFRKVFDEKLIGKIEVSYVFQEISNVPSGFDILSREKPWGTGHALLMARNEVKENFLVINADDFYGKKNYKIAFEALRRYSSDSNNYHMIGYDLESTISENGFVSRGECKIDEKGFLKEVVERTKIFSKDEDIYYQEGMDIFPIDRKKSVSMNFWIFTPTIFDFIEAAFYQFLNDNSKSKEEEFYIPMIINNLIQKKKISVKMIRSVEKWFGVTYKEDKKDIKEKIKRMKSDNLYPKKIWK